VEFALVFPIFLIAIIGVITLGLYVFYQQQLTNAAREAARFAAIHSATAQCPTVSWHDPQAPVLSYYRCDSPNGVGDPYPWPAMTADARSKVWGVAPSSVLINACWSGFVPPGSPPETLADYPSVYAGVTNQYVQCTIGGINPITDATLLDCRAGMTTASDDAGSDIPDNRVTVYACFQWKPPAAGMLLIPNQVTIRAVITEIIQRQQ
jgi:hypothetical protein